MDCPNVVGSFIISEMLRSEWVLLELEHFGVYVCVRRNGSCARFITFKYPLIYTAIGKIINIKVKMCS